MSASLLPGAKPTSRRQNLQRGRIAIFLLFIILLVVGLYYHSSASTPSPSRKRARQVIRAHPEQRYNRGDTAKRPASPPPSTPAIKGNRPNAFLNHEKSWQGWDHITHIFAL